MKPNVLAPQRFRAPHRWTMLWSRPVGWILDHLVYRTTVTGRANVPASGPVIFAGNHISFLDGPVMFGAAPRGMHILVKREMFRGFLGRVLHASGQIPVDRSGDRFALQCGRGLLDAGRCVGILPEGTRGNGDAGSISSGVAWLALNSGALVVPVAILGTRRRGEHRDIIPRPGRRLHVSFGSPMKVIREPGEPGRVSMDRAAAEIRRALADHVRAEVERSGHSLPVDEDTVKTSAGNPGTNFEAAGTPAAHR